MSATAYPIPSAALDDRLGWIGTSGSGKTYNAGSGVELLLQSGARVVIVDPLGVWWGLRLTAEGSPSKFTLPIFGGSHGDLPLNDHAGKLIGETVAGMRESCIIDLSGLQTKESERRFMLAFLESWYRHAANDPVHAVFDEADLFAPQNPSKTPSGPQLQALMEQIVRRGRVKGFIPWLITQRPAVLSKDVLSQVDGLVAFKLTAVQDRKAIGDWVKAQADEGQWPAMDASLPTMQRGQGIVWVPGRGVLKTVQFPRKATFDSSRTPKRGERRENRELKPLNLEALKGQLASLEEEQKASDPKALKAEVARLKRELAKAEKAKAAPAPAPIAAPVDARALEAAVADGRIQGFRDVVERLKEFTAEIAGTVGRTGAARLAVAPASFEKVEAADAPTGGPHQRILNSLAWWEALGHDAPLNEQVAFVAGYSSKSTGYTNPRGALKTAGLVDYPAPGRVSLTGAGEEKAEAPDAPPTGEELRRRVLAKLPGPQQRILSVLINAYPNVLANADCAELAGYSASSTGYTNPRGNLKTLSCITYPAPGQVRAADWLFP